MHWRALVVVLLLPSIALADPPALPKPQVVTYPPGDDKIVVVHKGEASPFTGQLFDDNTALRWAVWLQQYRDRYGLDMQAERDSCAIKLEAERKANAVDTATAETLNADLRTRLQASEAGRLKAEEELRNPSFFSRPSTWFGIGIFTTVAITVSTAYLVHQAK